MSCRTKAEAEIQANSPPIFASRDSVNEALAYAHELANAIQDSRDRVAAMTAVGVLMNTINDGLQGLGKGE